MPPPLPLPLPLPLPPLYADAQYCVYDSFFAANCAALCSSSLKMSSSEGGEGARDAEGDDDAER